MKSSENPVDLVSRGLMPSESIYGQFWFYGLYQTNTIWPTMDVNFDVKEENTEQKRLITTQVLSLKITKHFVYNVLMSFVS